MPTPLPLDDPRLADVENPDFVAGMIQIDVDRRSFPKSGSFDFGGDPLWLAGHRVLLPCETLPDGRIQPATALHWMAVFSDLEALRAWTLTPPGMMRPDAVLGPVVTHAAIVDVGDLQALTKSSGTIDRVLVNPMGPASADVKLDLLTRRTSSLGAPGDGAGRRRQRFGRHAPPGEGPVELEKRFLADPLVHPSGRASLREEIRSSYAQAEEAGLGGHYDEAAELYWSAERRAERLHSPQVQAAAAARAARWLRSAGKTDLAAGKAKVAWVGLSLCANQTWMHDELVFLATVALELGHDQPVFTRHDYMGYIARLHALAESARARSSDPGALLLAKKADKLALRVSYDLVATVLPSRPYRD